MITNRRTRSKVNVGQKERIASLASGSALLIWSLLDRSRGNIASAISGSYLLYRGVSGRDPVYRLLDIDRAGAEGIQVHQSGTITRPREEVFAFWRDFENLPRFMEHLKEVRARDPHRSHWIARAPLNLSISWDAEIIEEQTNERIVWRSLPGSQVQTSGAVMFTDAPLDYGTEIHVSLTYEPPLGSAGAAFAKLLGEEPHKQIRDDLRRLKQLLETGQISTVYGQSSGRVRQVEKERSKGAQRGELDMKK